MTNLIAETIRNTMPVTDRWAYFDHAAVAPIPQPAKQALAEWADDVANNGDAHWPKWRKAIEEVRTITARILNADESEIALIRNTTEGIGLVAEGFPWQPGDNVVVPAGEFPSNLYPWQNLESRGVEVRIVPIENERLDPSDIANACDARTRIVSVSWVGYATGWRNDLDDLAEVAHANDALLFVDGIQGFGMFPLDVEQTPIDFLAADGHKWLLGPEGAGVLYVRKPHLELLRPLGVGWNSAANAGDYANAQFVLKNSAGRYEGGTYGMGLLLGLAASMRLLFQFPVEQIEECLSDVTSQLLDRLAELNADIASDPTDERRSGIISFTLPGCEPNAIRTRCLADGIVTSCRAGRVRVSPHVYTNEDDLDRLFRSLASNC